MRSEQLDRILEGLGNSADQVADTLRANGVRGVRNAARFLNPIVRYAQQHVTVDALSLDMMKPGTLCLTFHDSKKEEMPLPRAVRQFLHRFNQGEFPDLEMTSDQL